MKMVCHAKNVPCKLITNNRKLFIFLDVILLTLSVCQGEVHSDRSASNGRDVHQHGEITHDAKAVEYLERYGYLSRRVEEDLTHSHVDRDHAVRTFQKFANVTETGEIDNETSVLMSQPRCGQAMVNSFRYWSDNSGLIIEETTSNSFDIEIRFVSGDHGDGRFNAFDGRGKSIAHAFLPPNGAAHFDEDESWTYHNNNGTELEMTAIHELGHSLGLIHSTVRESIMAPFYKKYRKGFQLNPIDVFAVQELYEVSESVYMRERVNLIGPPLAKQPRAPSETANNSTVDVTKTTDKQPIHNTSDIQLINNTSDIQLINNTNDKQPINNKNDKQPINNTSNIQPINNTSNIQPINNTGNIQPINNTSDIQVSINGTVKQRKKHMDICKARFDALCGGKDGRFNVFVGRYVYKLYSYCQAGDNCIVEGYPKLIRAVYAKGPKRVHAAAYIPDVRKRTYLFKGRKVWRYTGSKLDTGYPIKLNSDDLPYKPSAAYVQKTQYADYQLYLFGGKFFWEMNLYTNRIAHSKFLTNTYWNFMPKRPDAMLQTNDGNIYVFKGKFYSKYDYRRDIVSRKNLKAPAWIGRPCGWADKNRYKE